MRQAVSAVLMVEHEIFGIIRSSEQLAFPGYFSFPGGKVDEADLHETKKLAPCLSHLPVSHARTLERELMEETGIDLLTDIPYSVEFMGSAQTPDFNPVRFDTAYYLLKFHKLPFMKLCTREFSHSEWQSPKKLLRYYEMGLAPMVPVTRMILEALHDKTVLPLAISLAYDREKFVPMISPLSGIEQFMPVSPTLPPATRTNCFYLGEKTKLLIDPSPCDEMELKRLINSLGTRPIDKILLTHHHPDHHHLAPNLARHLNVPICMSARTLYFMQKKFPRDYFHECKLELWEDGMQITTWQADPVLIMDVPGHDDGQIALYNKNKNWFIAGDLIQTVGTVVIGDEEGDMQKYFASLAKVIALAPKTVFPSHGIAMGGCAQLERTLEHRKMRESQIIELMKKGAGMSEILSVVYQGLPKELERYALKTIEAHQKKINMEKLLGDS